jgi:RNA-binding protein
MILTNKEKRDLRSLGSQLKPEVWIGKGGISEGTLTAIENSFLTKDLVKIKILDNSPLNVQEVSDILLKKTVSEWVYVIGNTILLYRP